MKKLALSLISAVIMMSVYPVQSNAGTDSTTVSNTTVTEAQSAEVKILVDRLEQIKIMDKSNLTSIEKKELRNEVRSTKKRLHEVGGGLYISVGAAIIIVLLLIILL